MMAWECVPGPLGFHLERRNASTTYTTLLDTGLM